jgi:hypothetical protein
MGQLHNTLFDNSPELGLALVCDEPAAFLEHPAETGFKLLTGQEPVVSAYQTVEPVTVPMDFPRDYIRPNLAGLALQSEKRKSRTVCYIDKVV